YFDIAMDALRIDERTLRNELWQTIKAGANTSADQQSVHQKIVKATGAQPTVAEHRLLELLLHDEELRRAVLPRLEAADYEELPTASIFRALVQLEEEQAEVDFSSLSEKVGDDALAADLLPLLLMSESQRADGEAVDEVLAQAESCLNALSLMKVDRRINELGVEMAEAERAGNAERLDKLSVEYLEWSRRRNSLGDFRF
ncbi:MAG: DnaB-like helicase N-terminal domain-containing protein, partial [Pyrinomonadaceae bacterium]